MNQQEILTALQRIAQKINENNIEAWEDKLEETKQVVILEDFDRNGDDTDKEELRIRYNGWADDLDNLINEIKNNI